MKNRASTKKASSVSFDTNVINEMQERHECCGLRSYLDWKAMPSLNTRKPYFTQKFLLNADQVAFNLPDSCCKRQFRASSCGKDFVSIEKVQSAHGCREKLEAEVDYLAGLVFTLTGLCVSILLAA